MSYFLANFCNALSIQDIGTFKNGILKKGILKKGILKKVYLKMVYLKKGIYTMKGLYVLQQTVEYEVYCKGQTLFCII